MCHLAYTNFQRQGAVCNMTAGETMAAEKIRTYYIIEVWNHKTVSSHGSAKIAAHVRVYQLLVKYMALKTGADLVFTTNTLTDISSKL